MPTLVNYSEDTPVGWGVYIQRVLRSLETIILNGWLFNDEGFKGADSVNVHSKSLWIINIFCYKACSLWASLKLSRLAVHFLVWQILSAQTETQQYFSNLYWPQLATKLVEFPQANRSYQNSLSWLHHWHTPKYHVIQKICFWDWGVFGCWETACRDQKDLFVYFIFN